MKIRNFLCLLFLLSAFLVQMKSQVDINELSEKSLNTGSDEQNSGYITNANQNPSKIRYNVEIGSMFSTSKNFGNMLSFYTNPELMYRLSPKMNITTGLILINSNKSSYYLGEKQSVSTYKAYLTASLNYNPTQKLRITGEILYGMNKNPNSPFYSRTSPEYMVRFNAEYKITENLSVGLQVINQNLNQGNYCDPYGNYTMFPSNRYSQYYGF